MQISAKRSRITLCLLIKRNQPKSSGSKSDDLNLNLNSVKSVKRNAASKAEAPPTPPGLDVSSEPSSTASVSAVASRQSVDSQESKKKLISDFQSSPLKKGFFNNPPPIKSASPPLVQPADKALITAPDKAVPISNVSVSSPG